MPSSYPTAKIDFDKPVYKNLQSNTICFVLVLEDYPGRVANSFPYDIAERSSAEKVFVRRDRDKNDFVTLVHVTYAVSVKALKVKDAAART